MCFSASASFGAGTLLTVIGIVSVKKVKNPNHYFFAAIPLIFAVQQFSEGVLWLTLPYPEYQPLQNFATYTFLIFAQVIWPICVPLSFLLFDKKNKYIKLHRLLVTAGIIVSIYLSYAMISFPVKAEIVEHHIMYHQDYPLTNHYLIATLYVIAIIIPPFLFPITKMKYLGSAILISCVITAIFYENYLVSVWCFFSSIISVFVYKILGETEYTPVKKRI
jgi:hypothetical protein